MANTSPVTDTAEAAEHLAALGRRDGYAQVVPVGAVSKGLAGTELAELGLMARSRGRRTGVLRRRPVRRRRPADAPGAGVRPGLRRGGRPARPGPAARRAGRLLPRGRDLRAARAARLAGGRRGEHRGPRRPAGRADPVPAARLPRLDRGDGRGAPLGQAARAAGHRRGHPAPPAADHRRGARATTRPTRSTRRCGRPRTSRRYGTRCPTAPSTPWPPTTPRTPGTTRSTPSPRPRSACSAWRPRSRVVLETMIKPAGSAGARSPSGCRSCPPTSLGCPTRAGRSRSARRQPGPGRPHRAGRRGPERLRLPVPQQPLARPRAARPGGRHRLGRPGHLPPLTVAPLRQVPPPRALATPSPRYSRSVRARSA